ncbi:MAG TPA: hypothetical protein VGJ63_02160 [Micromonosporaceae bacterium]|nr:hypothetical protein [Actinoplanes sp.]
MQLAAAADAFALELNRFAAPPARTLDHRDSGQAALDDRSTHRL